MHVGTFQNKTWILHSDNDMRNARKFAKFSCYVLAARCYLTRQLV